MSCFGFVENGRANPVGGAHAHAMLRAQAKFFVWQEWRAVREWNESRADGVCMMVFARRCFQFGDARRIQRPSCHEAFRGIRNGLRLFDGNDESDSYMSQRVDSRQLRAVTVPARAGSFPRIAQELHRSQSAISHTMKTLEYEIDCRLLGRVGKIVALQAGEPL